jgi:hypothetical protein
MLGDGSGAFVLGTIVPVSQTPNVVKLADLNGDSKLDIVVAKFDGIAVLLNAR